MGAYFSNAALRFLRGLRRNNNRDWFNQRKDLYLREVFDPMVRLCEDVAGAMADFAPEHVQPAHKAMMRIYENLRFHAGRPPFKTRLGAWWGRRGIERTSGAGYYLHLSATGFEVSAGCFMPRPDQLLRIRESIAKNPKPLRDLLTQPKLVKLLPERVDDSLAHAPKGFSAADPAIALLRCVKWGRMAMLPPEAALDDGLLREVVRRFSAAARLVAYLNEPIPRRRPGGHPFPDRPQSNESLL